MKLHECSPLSTGSSEEATRGANSCLMSKMSACQKEGGAGRVLTNLGAPSR